MVKYLLRVQVARVRFPPKPPFLIEGYQEQTGVVVRPAWDDIVWEEGKVVKREKRRTGREGYQEQQKKLGDKSKMYNKREKKSR